MFDGIFHVFLQIDSSCPNFVVRKSIFVHHRHHHLVSFRVESKDFIPFRFLPTFFMNFSFLLASPDFDDDVRILHSKMVYHVGKGVGVMGQNG